MDSYGQIGPEKPGYAEAVTEIARAVSVEATLFVALANKGSRLNMVIVHRDGLVTLGARPEGVYGQSDLGYLFVAVEEHGAYWFRLGDFHQPSYVAGKLGIAPVDGDTVAEFLTRLGDELKQIIDQRGA